MKGIAIVGSLLATAMLAWPDEPTPATRASSEPAVFHYRPERRVPPSLEPVVRHLQPGTDAFPEEKDALELSERLAELGKLLRERRAPEAAEALLAPDFKGSRLTPVEEKEVTRSPSFEVFRSPAMPQALERDRRTFGQDIERLIAGMDEVRVAEFLITSIAVQREAPIRARTEVRFDLVGSAKESWRLQRTGRWRIDWRREPDGIWRVASWTALDQSRSRAPAPVFTEVTGAALAQNASFREQLTRGLDSWLGRLDAVFLPGGMGHHGVSVGDADGDGKDDLYVAQPSGLPNRLYRNEGNGTFTDITEAAGVGVLDSTSQSLFVDVDNDGDQDLLLVTRTGLLLFINDGKGHFTESKDAFRFKGALRGSPTSVAMADYDRDGFLDLYLCTYAYFIGASEDKAGTPTPYHDAQNGPPNVLLRNDGHGHFVDVTGEAGLLENNNRFSFAASWADYDEDGWPDLLVANDFGRKNLYHNEGLKNGRVVFKDVASQAGVEDYGAGMSAAFLDYDNDGHLDIYTGNMWTAAGLRVTSEPGFKPDAPAAIRELYKRHARGNSLFRNRGDGTFEDVSLAAGAEMGRWAWSSDGIDFDNDGFEDLYVVNGMFTRDPGEEGPDLDSFFWRQVTARSPLDAKRGTSFDDAWRATNRQLAENGSQAQHERNVFLRNDGHGGFVDVSGSVGLDLDQDGRSFAVLDFDGDGDSDLVVMAARSSPQLRLFRNDLGNKNASLAVRLTGKSSDCAAEPKARPAEAGSARCAGPSSNRDAVGARVTVVTDTLRATKIVQAGSGFISQHSKELLFGLGQSRGAAKLEIRWPSGAVQTLTGLEVNHRVLVEEGNDTPRTEPFRKVTATPSAAAAAPVTDDDRGPHGTWLYRSVPAPDFAVRDLAGQERSLSSLHGKPALLLFWSLAAPPSRRALEELAAQAPAFAAAGVPLVAVAVDKAEEESKVREAAKGVGLSVALAGAEVAGTYSVLSRYLFDRREDLRLPTLLLLNPQGEIVKVYRDRIVAASVLADLSKIEAPPLERLTRAAPFAGAFHTAPGERNDFQYSLDLAEQGYERASLAGFRRVTKQDPSAIAFYNLGTLSMKAGQPAEARQAFERALAIQPDHAEAGNSLGALLAQSGDVPGAIARFRAALQVRPDFADALNNLGYALFQGEQDQQAYELYQKALAAEPEFPEALNNLGIFFGQRGDLAQAESFFKRAVAARPSYGEATNNLALVLGARGDGPGAIALLQRFLEKEPTFEPSYVTLAKVYLSAGRKREGIQVLELLLQRNPKNPAALGMLAQLKAVR
jgi:tetratricopeptide (TPR) repeat protein